jgi:hypothetical protein
MIWGFHGSKNVDMVLYPEVESYTLLRNTGNHLQHYTASQPKNRNRHNQVLNKLSSFAS